MHHVPCPSCRVLGNAIEGIYIQKTREVINGMRSASGAKEKAWESIQQSLNLAVGQHGKK